MRHLALVLGLVVGLCAGPGLAQPAARTQIDTAAQPLKYWIFLTDKLGPAGKAAPVEPGYLSARAHARRAARGATPSPRLDAPLSETYIDALHRLGVSPHVRSRWLNAVSATLTPEQKRQVENLPFVRALRPVGRTHTLGTPLVSPLPGGAASGAAGSPMRLDYGAAGSPMRLDYGGSLTQLEQANILAPLERGLNGTGVRLGLIDTGIGDLTGIPVFAALLADGRLVESRDFTGLPDDGNRHARSVLSIAVGFDEGNLIGPAYGAEVLHARTEYVPTETNQEEDNLVAALEWMESEGVDVVNISLGYSVFDAGQVSYTYDDMDGNTAVTTVAVDLAAGLGVVVVTSAGNDGGCGSPLNCWYYVASPADADSSITVGAVTATGSKAGFSSFGPTADGRTKPDVMAMGAATYHYSSGGAYAAGNGTSFSSPIVTGVVAQMLQANPALTPIEVRDILRQTASNAATPNNSIGWGIIDADAATLMAVAAGTEGDLPDAVTLLQPYPNPFSTSTVIEVRAPAPTPARLTVFDLLGRRVAIAFDGLLQSGLNALPIDGRALPAGIYYYTLEAGSTSATGTVVKVK